MSGWQAPRRRPAGRGPAPAGAWGLALSMARDAWCELGGEPVGPGSSDAVRAAVLTAAVGLVGLASSRLREDAARAAAVERTGSGRY